ncbi:PucR family transcriptional regulator [Tenuibacillus multivorans]|uniref:PucR C-terminal helix-turn-helix domain-containing protein n=1 Tax=Tenuibacillus multivorans TaxID=237069 RepID=A0A1H0C5T4_9BACI|nr:helix-turn-helix domain-containing protein [Tenuibacillus multivorans]GEL77777.1 Fis family transcriptional regulator [Tenuibacillus multivorans]SDN53254.1 PucR C-terminal helix-turn-helix domain-containing protein [Tenuibacillus multivorans]
MDLEKLSQLFPNIKRVDIPPEDCFTFQTDGRLFAIPETDLTHEQKQLLQALTTTEPIHTSREQAWLDFLHRKTSTPPEEFTQYRFIIANIQDGSIDLDTFRNTLHMMLNRELVLTWKSKNEVVMIEEIAGEPIAFNEMIDVMSDDLKINLKLFISDIQQSVDQMVDYYQWLIKVARAIFPLTGKRIIYQQDSIIHLFPTLFDQNDQQFFISSILKSSIEDRSLIDTIKVVIEHQGNVSSAAKALFMHRNSVQYRIDKFADLTGNDIRRFDHMLQVYLAILLLV